MDMTKLKEARINKILKRPLIHNKQHYNSLEEFFKKVISRVEKIETDNMICFNRTRFNRMDNNRDQEEYMLKLKEKKLTYRAYLKSSGFITIKQLQYEGFRKINSGMTMNLEDE